MKEKYEVKIILRTFDQSSDDWHATVRRRHDGVELIFISAWRWLLKWRVRRAALDRAFRSYDKRQALVENSKEVYYV